MRSPLSNAHIAEATADLEVGGFTAARAENKRILAGLEGRVEKTEDR